MHKIIPINNNNNIIGNILNNLFNINNKGAIFTQLVLSLTRKTYIEWKR